MSDAGCDSGRADLRKGSTAVQQQLGERSEKCERNSSAATNQGQCKRRAEAAPDVELKFLCSPGGTCGGTVVPLQPLGTIQSLSPHVFLEKPTGQQWMWPGRGCSGAAGLGELLPAETHAEAVF